MSLQTKQAKVTVEEIKAENAAHKEGELVAEAHAEVVVVQAQQLAEAVEDVLEELKDAKAGSGRE